MQLPTADAQSKTRMKVTSTLFSQTGMRQGDVAKANHFNAESEL